MREATALEVAVGLLQLPSRVRTLRDGDLPADLEMLLRIVAGDDRALSEAMATTEQSASRLQAAASFYIEQILLHPGADSYRALGARPDATLDQLRRNMALLLRWLHPDRDGDATRALFANRVTQAWNNVKTVERRALYDSTIRSPVNDRAKPNARRDSFSPLRPTHPGPAATGAPMPAGAKHRGGRGGAGKRSRPHSIWRFLKHLMGHGRH
jgi:hypothetical protein